MDAGLHKVDSSVITHQHHFNVHFLPRSIKGIDSCFPDAKVDNHPLVFSHHKAVPWEYWNEFLVTGCPS